MEDDPSTATFCGWACSTSSANLTATWTQSPQQEVSEDTRMWLVLYNKTPRHGITRQWYSFSPRHRLLLHILVKLASVFLGAEVEVGPASLGLSRSCLCEWRVQADRARFTVLDPEVFPVQHTRRRSCGPPFAFAVEDV